MFSVRALEMLGVGGRNLVALDRCNLCKGGPVKALAHGSKKTAGKITVRHRGGGHKRGL